MQGKIKNIPVEEQGFKSTVQRYIWEGQGDTKAL
jgi:hypothetical protein